MRKLIMGALASLWLVVVSAGAPPCPPHPVPPGPRPYPYPVYPIYPSHGYRVIYVPQYYYDSFGQLHVTYVMYIVWY